jgi:hypothetical protein
MDLMIKRSRGIMRSLTTTGLISILYLLCGLVSDEEEQPLIVKMTKRKTTTREIPDKPE